MSDKIYAEGIQFVMMFANSEEEERNAYQKLINEQKIENIKEQKQDKYLLITVLMMISFGLFMLFSASWVKSLDITGGESRTFFLTSQMLKLLPAFFIFFRFLALYIKVVRILSKTYDLSNNVEARFDS